MKHLIDKDALVAEIKRLLTFYLKEIEDNKKDPWAMDIAKRDILQKVLSFINTLEVKEIGNNFWKPADGDDLPIFDREVIVLIQPYPLEGTEYAVSFAHRLDPNGYDGKSITTSKIEHYTPKTYDKGGWSISNVVWWLDLDLPK